MLVNALSWVGHGFAGTCNKSRAISITCTFLGCAQNWSHIPFSLHVLFWGSTKEATSLFSYIPFLGWVGGGGAHHFSVIYTFMRWKKKEKRSHVTFQLHTLSWAGQKHTSLKATSLSVTYPFLGWGGKKPLLFSYTPFFGFGKKKFLKNQ